MVRLHADEGNMGHTTPEKLGRMTETFFDGRVTLHLCDCRDILRDIKADHVITDPPYEAHMHAAKLGKKVYGAKRRIRQDGYADPPPIDFASIDGLRETCTQPIVDACKGWFIAFCTPEGIAPWRDAIEAAGARYKRACFYCKPDSAPQFNGQGPAFAVEPFVTAWCGRNISRWNGGGRRNWWIFPTNNPGRQGEHPTEKPIDLMVELVRLFTNPDDLICDPFMGSGTTALAAIAEGRRFIGMEINARYYALARARIAASISMGRDEGARHIARAIGKIETPGPLFDGI
jgi:site-specific DNA-methyltransferase (adenine-specific)